MKRKKAETKRLKEDLFEFVSMVVSKKRKIEFWDFLALDV